PIESTPAVANYSLPYGSHPFRPSRTETHHGRFIPEKQLAQSDDCASCHKDIAKQWQVSAHRHAADDPAYVTNIKLLIETQGIAAARYCEGCHAPVALLSGQLSPGGTHGGIEGSPANVEGVGCVGCHGMNSIVDTKGVASFEMGAPSSYLFSYSDSSIAQSIRHQIIKLSPDMHRREMTPRGVNDSSFCASCHVQFMDEEVNHWGWVQMQDDYSAWLESPFSGLNSDEFGKTTTARCQDCHMPATVASDPSSNRDGSISAHYFTGANTMLAMHFGHEQHLRRTKEFLRAGQLTITIEPPHRRDAVQTLQSIRESVRATSETPAYVLVGDRVDISVTLSNRGVGHDFPGGTIDINEAWIEFLVIDGGGKEVYSSGKISGDDYSVLGVDPDAEFYRSRPVDRTGSLVWKHDLFRRTGIAEKRVIASGKSDLLRYEFAVPDWVAPPLTIVASLKYRKLNDRYARWALGDSYSDLPVVSLARDSIIVPVRTELDTRSID
ncbi:MAG: multiheme c-type cytochrome, partial [Pseudomonadota bacterium]